MKNILDLPPSLSGSQANRLDIRQRTPAPKTQDHFLSIICFDGNVTANTVDAIMQIQHTRRLWSGWKFHPGEGQVRSRNECAHVFLHQTPFSHHTFLDADVIPRAEHIMALRRHPEAADSIICGPYCKKVDRIEHVYNSLKGGNPEPNKLGLMEVAKGPTGCMQIPRSAYERIAKKFPERFYKCDYEMDEKGQRRDKFSFFFHDIRQDAELGFMRDQSEDWAFCEMARAAGVKIYVDISTTEWLEPNKPCLLHRGPALYPLRTELERLHAVDSLAEEKKKHAAEVAHLKSELERLQAAMPSQ